MALALHGIGLTTERALSVVAQIWRAAPMDDTIKWKEIVALNLNTLQALDGAGLLRNRRENDFRMARHDWLFPLYPLDLFPVTEMEEDLREVQRSWWPDWH